jgi:hypothetical protein
MWYLGSYAPTPGEHPPVVEVFNSLLALGKEADPRLLFESSCLIKLEPTTSKAFMTMYSPGPGF